MILRILMIALLGLASQSSLAAIDAYSFPNDEMRDRYHVLIDELRCPQCLNTNLAGSDSMIASDLRREVHRLLLEGYTDEEVLTFMHDRYGDFILYEPRVQRGTLLLWFGPLVLLLLAVAIGWRVTRGTSKAEALSSDEAAQLDSILNEKK